MDLKARLADVDARIVDAARSAGRDPGEITRVVVTKFHPASLVRELYDLGVRDVGENRQQELTAKRAELADLPHLRWHFVGQAQTNKARAIREAAAVVHSVDRARLADALEAAGQSVAGVLDVLLQVNLTDDAGRGGTSPDDVPRLAEHIAGSCPTLRVRGVMGVAPLDEPAADAFARLAAARDQVRAVVPDAGWMSAGMTGDFSEAIAAGATHLRIGSAITGPRPVHG
ncbi:YggS family pyridoxal phosphate-dependent enzyme [Microbacterium jiangjiandongii]|uniref:YggS family pyridoxal phosphate-dependent enzyme n=1 Tax=Microbacterium jiangjiandongii TaxID=3049071 RepID=UPI00214CB181|nr:YggS family pyridoxal phosphate-dependent enzyme [Microbacterium sp. zg.Y843]MCR2816955.1 YggS family pyridoxal phosphate-dependent enzyme [Microbacterium sp. zg.Y843]